MKLKKIFKVIFINFLLFIMALFTVEFVLYVAAARRALPRYFALRYFRYDEAYQFIKKNKFRKPEGLEYNSRPILIMGCSYAYGWSLLPQDNLQGKLSRILKRPVFNRSFELWGPQNMLYQSRLEEFYKEVPNPEFVIYILIPDHIRRINSRYGQDFYFYPYLHYVMKDSRLVQDKYNMLTYNSLFLKKYDSYKYNRMPLEERTKYLNEYFIETKQEFDKHWKDYKFIILTYDDYEHKAKVVHNSGLKELEKQGFYVIYSSDLVGRYMNQHDDWLLIPTTFHPHPSRIAWEVIAPKLAEKLNELSNQQ